MNMKPNIKKIGAFALAGVLLASAASTVLSSDVFDDNTPLDVIHDSVMQAFDNSVLNTVVADVENEQPIAVSSEKIVKYSMLGC